MSEMSSSSAPRPIAVLVDREGLGDSLLKFPFLRAIRRGFPGCPIWWIATHQTSMATELAPFVAALIDRVIDHAGLTGKSREVRERLRALPPFDLVFESRTHIPSVLLTRTLLTYNGFYCCLPGYVLSDRRPPGRWTRPAGIAERMLSLADAALGKPADWQGTLEVSPAARALAAERLPSGPRYIGLATGSREVRKNWPVERYIALAQALEASGRTPVFLIGPQERELLEKFRTAVPSALFPEATPPDPALGLARLEFAIAICHRLAAAVANDSGIGHLLGAIGTPLVTLFGPTDAARWAPFTRAGIIVRSQEFGGDTMDAIPVEPVLRAVDEVSMIPKSGSRFSEKIMLK
jgi:ADP-heptose:LPS heptosyltransferase